MPNWCTQRLTIELLGERDLARETEILQSLSEEGEYGQEFDFNKIIEMPKGLLETESSSRNILGLQLYINKTLREISGNEVAKFNFQIDVVRRSYPNVNLIMRGPEFEEFKRRVVDFSEVLELGKKCFNNLIKTGYANWYTWANANWGVKWNASDSIFNGNSVIFQTAWGPAIEVINELAEQYPNCRLTLDFAEEQVSAFAGHYVWENGERVEQEDYDSCTKECFEMAFDLGVACEGDYDFDGDTYHYRDEE